MLRCLIIVEKKRSQNLKKESLGQMSLEFIFSMMIIVIVAYSLVNVLLWGGLDLGNRQRSHQKLLTMPVQDSPYVCINWSGGMFNRCLEYAPASNGPLAQIDPFFYYSSKMNAYWSLK